jgi:hypothetical protein
MIFEANNAKIVEHKKDIKIGFVFAKVLNP